MKRERERETERERERKSEITGAKFIFFGREKILCIIIQKKSIVFWRYLSSKF